MANVKNHKKQIELTKRTLIIVAVIMFVCSTFANAQSEEKAISVEGITTISIKVFDNSVKIMPWDSPDVIVKAIEGGVNIDVPKIERKENKLELEMPKNSDLEQYEIYMPEDMGLEITSMNASVYITGINGKKKIDTFNGNIEIRDVVGSVSAKTFNGNIIADIRLDDKSDFNTVNGAIDILITDSFSMPLSLNTVSGSIALNLPEDYKADLDASAISGQVICDVPIDGGVEGHSIKGKIYGGGPALKLKTISGNISIKPTQTISESTTEKSIEHTDKPKIIEKPNVRKANKSILPRIEIAKTLNPPKIDGRLDDDSWKDASKIEDFVWADGIGKPNEPTEAYLLWDDQNLYIGVRCFESNMDSLKITHTEDDEWLWEDDDIQLLIDPTPNNISDYYHIIVNSIGIIFDMEVNGVQPENRRTFESKLGKKWSFRGEVDTDIRDNFWAVEISIPFSSIAETKPQAGDLWKLNLHRLEQRRKEYTYWSPTYFSPDWPHIPARFGEIIFSADQQIPDLSQSPTEPVLEAKIVEIAIEGNDKIAQEDILAALKLKIGDIANLDTLSRAKVRLEAMGWFQKVNMDLDKNEAGVKLLIKLTEKDVISPTDVVITGSTIFTKDELIDFFNLKPSKITSQDVAIKCKLIAELYKSKDYEMATAKCTFNESVLNINIDEGRIDKIEVYGNNKIKTDEIIKHLNLKVGMPFKRSDINDAIKAMEHELPYFRYVHWTPKKSDDGLNIVSIEVKEGSIIEHDFQTITDFDRVHGFSLGVRPGLTSKYWGSKIFFSIRYGFSSEIWNYQFGAEKSFFRDNKMTFGADIHRLTDTNDREIISDKEHVIAEFVLGEAFRDFYQREGYEASFSQKLPIAMQIGVKYRDDEYTSLEKTEDWSILNRYYNEEYADIDYKIKRRNPPIYGLNNPLGFGGRMKSVIAECAFDTRNKEATSGWHNTASIERAGDQLGGDYEFTIYQANIRGYSRIARNQFFAFRMKAAIADRELEIDHPKRFYLGGIGTLRGYSYKEFDGDKMALINAEYWFRTGRFGLGLSVFFDSGYVWNYNDEMKVSDLKTDVGVGIALGSIPGSGLIFNIATPIDEKDRQTIVSVRLDRMF